MPSTGNIFAGTGENVDRSGLTAWTTPGNITADDASDATCNGAGSDYLVARNFAWPGGGVPSDATILGVLARVEASEHSAGTEALLAQLQNDTATLVGSSKSASNEGNISGTATAVYTYGSASDTWGATLTPAIVNDPDFGVRFWFTTSHDVWVDYVTMDLTYSDALWGIIRAGSWESFAGGMSGIQFMRRASGLLVPKLRRITGVCLLRRAIQH